MGVAWALGTLWLGEVAEVRRTQQTCREPAARGTQGKCEATWPRAGGVSRRTKKPSLPKAADRPRTLATRKGPCLRAVGWSGDGVGTRPGEGLRKEWKKRDRKCSVKTILKEFHCYRKEKNSTMIRRWTGIKEGLFLFVLKKCILLAMVLSKMKYASHHLFTEIYLSRLHVPEGILHHPLLNVLEMLRTPLWYFMT